MTCSVTWSEFKSPLSGPAGPPADPVMPVILLTRGVNNSGGCIHKVSSSSLPVARSASESLVRPKFERPGSDPGGACGVALTMTSRWGSLTGKCQCGPRVTVQVTQARPGPEERRHYPGQARTGSARCRRAGVTYFTRSSFRVKFKFPCTGTLLVRSDPGPDQPEWPAGSRGGRAGRQAAGRLVEGGAVAPLHRNTPGPKP